MPFPVPPKIPSQTIVASCALCFLSLEAWSRAVSSSSNLFELPCAPYAADVALSSALHTAGCTTFAPTREIAVRTGATYSSDRNDGIAKGSNTVTSTRRTASLLGLGPSSWRVVDEWA